MKYQKYLFLENEEVRETTLEEEAETEAETTVEEPADVPDSPEKA